MNRLTLGSLFDGSGGFPLAGVLNGIEPIWAAEVEPYPIVVTTSRFPQMRHLGDVSQVKGSEISPVDIITFGSPCQDMSIAGKRAGMKHEVNGDEETTRSGLFYEAVRIIREMREATHGRYPAYAVWENVPGAFSSNGGADFRCVLEELFRICAGGGASIPEPKGGKWRTSGCVIGDGCSLAWRVLDAQYWGVPQRRRRIYLVADFTDECAGEILFEPEGLRGDSETSRETRQNAAAGADGSLAGGNRCILNDQGGSVMDVAANVVATLRAQSHNHDPIACYMPKERGGCAGGGKGPLLQINKSATLATTQDQTLIYDARGNGGGEIAPTITGDHEGRVSDYTAVLIENHPADSRVSLNDSGIAQTLTSRMGTGGG